MTTQILFQTQSVLILLLMFAGVYIHKKRKLHIKTMSTAMIWDILLILQIELNREAILKATNIATSHVQLKIHLFFAVSSVLLYLIMVKSGLDVLKNPDKRSLHKKLGITTLFFRTMTLITSFWAPTMSSL